MVDAERVDLGSEALNVRYEADQGVLQAAYDKACDIFGVMPGVYRLEARTLTETLYRKYQFAQQPPKPDDWAYYREIQGYLVYKTIRHVRSAVDILQTEYGIDILRDRRALQDKATFTRVKESLNAKTGDNRAGFQQIEEDNMPYVFATYIANLFGNNTEAYRRAIVKTENTLGTEGLMTNVAAQAVSQNAFYEVVVRNMSQARYEAQQQLRALCSDDLTAYLDFAEEVLVTQSHLRTAREVLAADKQELDFKILPEGTILREAAETIARESTAGERARVDLNRLTVLEAIRQHVGEGRSYYVRGKPRGAMRDADGALINQDYIGLVIQNYGEDGATVVSEDCLAISPIARKHAGFLARYDASEGIPWRDVLTMPKNDAVMVFNARRIRFDPVEGADTYEAYTQKIIALLGCSKDQFMREYILRRNKNGTYGLQHRGKALGNIGLTASGVTE